MKISYCNSCDCYIEEFRFPLEQNLIEINDEYITDKINNFLRSDKCNHFHSQSLENNIYQVAKTVLSRPIRLDKGFLITESYLITFFVDYCRSLSMDLQLFSEIEPECIKIVINRIKDLQEAKRIYDKENRFCAFVLIAITVTLYAYSWYKK